ncbi:hypothetical protein [Streptomyces sp. MZ04]|uniref:hypothetical protein n=1 Tax=Streptomyces sp. MZ04 TaxID=2559236 RepID=UPI00107EE247|nr:hypothetical protein [Streptomyces sp. MZ04]TGB15660.1 hypothetical protein E2651_02030 [Streptomyces sp. MZ04]
MQVAPHEEWSVAGRTPWGSVLRAFTYDYTKERLRSNLGGYRIPAGPLPGDSGKITGSKVALFGASPELTPTVLSGIARGESLPYPTQNGKTAEENGIRLGVHTISDFISTDDAYVRAPADDRLALGGRAELPRPLAAGDSTL